MRHLQRKNLLIGTAMSLLATSVWAQDVRLTALDGDVTISGELLAFDGNSYTISTVLGRLELDASMVRCDGEACPAVTAQISEFRISGSPTLGKDLIPGLLSAYGSSKIDAFASVTQSNGQRGAVSYEVMDIAGDKIAAVDIGVSNTTDGLADLLQGEAMIALASRPARNREARAFEEAGFGDIRAPQNEHIVALDGLLLVTSPDNPVRAITEQNAALAFAGRITNWAELGGRDAPINIYVRDTDSGIREVFDNLLMRPNGLQIGRNVTLIQSDEVLSQVVANDPNGLGFTNFADGEGAKALAIEGVCGLQTPPNAFTIKTEEYPLTRLLYMYTADERLPVHAKGMLDYALSEDAQALISDAGFIDQTIRQASVDSQGLRVASAVVANRDFSTFPQLQEMMSQLISSDRLSTTFRFETGSSQLDARAQDDIVRLAKLLSSDAYRNTEAVFVGFTDSVGDPELNRQLSERRAGQVVQALLDENPNLQENVALRTIGYGEISPLGCNETNTGRRINRRVEVWVRDVVARN
ncbi:phosphate ABC transporter substrate-binding/OmpA family protein [Cognatiyoonia sp. IB215182]|uniref:phosphate ABC transporter substrate-binding/OmpA family protein n=1 Tax=Cognatiyoonia sp. IB215182 TaxID=3097353 RepID=UPI002A126B58|nr:phosphate ABC transporter substrate-binding/OmpA family protein [Cognatiyoonia sp. IB215182]MDX8352458.1 phosphate ABC transporter substrate-binding/OmpA family protein [Cognatiyoonia sp. IB215182]